MMHRMRLVGALAALITVAGTPLAVSLATTKAARPLPPTSGGTTPAGTRTPGKAPATLKAPRTKAPVVGVVTVSPLRGDTEASPYSQISFLGAPAAALQGISVLGSSSGRHSGHLRSYQSAPGASFIPHSSFRAGERVTVRARLITSTGTRSLYTSFRVSRPAIVAQNRFPVMGNPADVQHFQSRPDLHPTKITITQAPGAVAPGYLFSTPELGPGQYGPMIYDSSGQVVWFSPLSGENGATDFRVQNYRGKPALTMWQGQTNSFGYGLGQGVIYDSAYRRVGTVRLGNGLSADEHEFLLTPQGSAYLTAYNPVHMSAAPAGGSTDAVVLDGVAQRVDVATGLVMYEWHSLDHVGLSESYSAPPTTAGGVFDYFHINSLDVDRGGNLLLSARNTWGLYAISAHSGALLWRLNGKRSTLKLGAGVPFAFQHNAIWRSANTVSLFDDECCAKRGAPPAFGPSRGEVVKIDLAQHTASLVQQFVHQGAKPLVTASQGSNQLLPNGDWLVGLGGLPNFTEYDSRGQMIFDGTLAAGEFSYRTYREVWGGQPTTLPDVAAKASGATMTVYASWNGSTTVASWQVLSGASAATLTPGVTAARSGFETAITSPASAFVAVRALSASGSVLATSKVVAVTP